MEKPKRAVSWIILFLAAIGLTILTSAYVRPAVCQLFCDEPEQAPCPEGACRFGEQRAGFPLPVLQDRPSGSSPTSGWARLGAEDFPNLGYFILDVFFYLAFLLLLINILQLFQGKLKLSQTSGLIPLLVIVTTGLVWGYWLEQSWTPKRPSSATGQAQQSILGNWRAVDDASNQEILLRFYEQGRISLQHPRSIDRMEGEYRWVENQAIRVLFQRTTTPAPGEVDFCSGLPSILLGVCVSSPVTPVVYDPEAYPGLIVEPASLYPGLCPADTPAPQVISKIDSLFDITIVGDELTLHQQNGTVQTFYRARGN